MKILNVLSVFAISLLLSFSAYGQQIPVGQMMAQISCNLVEGRSIDDVVAWVRANPRVPGSANQVFLREPIIANPNFTENYDFRIVTYFASYGDWISQGEARIASSGEARVRPTPLARDMFSCNGDSQSVTTVRAVPDGDTFDGDVTLLSSRFCRLNEGSSVADAYNFVAGVAAGFRRGGDNALMQVSSRAFGPIPNTTRGRAVVVTSVSATADSMATRLDLSREGLNVTEGLDSVMSCGFSALWRTHAVYRGN